LRHLVAGSAMTGVKPNATLDQHQDVNVGDKPTEVMVVELEKAR
jgi:hypothetical protein